jgi:hypothetical protein
MLTPFPVSGFDTAFVLKSGFSVDPKHEFKGGKNMFSGQCWGR